jgi:dihydroorotate dehydrogenase electron transfer subunit
MDRARPVAPDEWKESLNMDDVTGTVVSNRSIGAGHFMVRVRLPKPPGPVVPGQFVMVRLPTSEVFLRRPFSICSLKGDLFSIMYKLVGKGTEFLCTMKRGQSLMVLGPLGKGFVVDEDRAAIVVAGGIGIAGVRLLVDRHKGPLKILYGCKTAEETALLGNLKHTDVLLATLDGSQGFHGTVIDLLAEHLDGFRHMDPVIFSCGPQGMLASLKRLLEGRPVPCQVAVEERMACGLGLCFGCVIRTENEEEPYMRVCKEGPVFDLWQLSL